MLQELSMVEQRYLAVREVLDAGAAISDVAARYGVDRKTLYRWLVRYANGGLGSLADRSCKPDRCPHQISAEVEARIEGPGAREIRGSRERALGVSFDPARFRWRFQIRASRDGWSGSWKQRVRTLSKAAARRLTWTRSFGPGSNF